MINLDISQHLKKSLFVLTILACCSTGTVWAGQGELEKKWSGTWKYVDKIEDVMPEEAPAMSVNVYDNLEISNVTDKGFSYRNVGNDVGYGPNEETYAEGTAVFTEQGNAKDKASGLRILFYQGKNKWDRGISLVQPGNKEKKHFKQVRTVFEAGFNCDKAGTHIEKRICHVALLARADKELGQLYKSLRKKLPKDKRSKLRRSQRAWMKKRNKFCQDKNKADEDCLSAFYASRLLSLRKMSDPDLGNKTQSLDADYMKAIYTKSPRLWEDTVIQLIFKSLKQDSAIKKWKTYRPAIKASFTNGEAVFSGQFIYETIIWPSNVIITVDFQFVVDEKAQMWFSTSTDQGQGHDVQTHFGPKKQSKSVKNWLVMMKK